MTHSRVTACVSWCLALLLACVTDAVAQGQGQSQPGSNAPGRQVAQDAVNRVHPRVRERVEREGRTRVIVEFALDSGPFQAESAMPDVASVTRQREAIQRVGGRVLSGLNPASFRILRRFATSPHLAIEIDALGLAALERASDVLSVVPDELVRPTAMLDESVPLVEGDQAWDAGFDGTGTVVAVLDTGVDASHPFLQGKVVSEACYSTTAAGQSESVCPNGQSEQIGPGAAAPCQVFDCLHGTHVAGIAVGNGATAGVPFSGVAKGAKLIAVQVFSEVINPLTCGGSAPCVGAYTSDVIAGLERVYLVSGQFKIAAVNLSLGGELFSAPCDTEPYKPIIDNLRAAGIATIVASGNSASGSAIATPACISSAISVASSGLDDQVSWFSNVAPFLTLFAPGDNITSSVPGGAFLPFSGTSMAAPHVAGAWAVLRQAVPNVPVATMVQALTQNGLPITDTRLFGGGSTVPRLRLFRALAALANVQNPSPISLSLNPSHISAGSGPFTLTVSGSHFNTFSVVKWNDSARPTFVAGTNTLRVSIGATDIAAQGSAQVTVVTPEPGGGMSGPLIFTVDPPPALTVDKTTVAPGSQVTVTLSNGIGGERDWLALASVGSSDSTYVQWTYVGTGVTTRTWTVTLPTSGGPFEFRLFLNGGTTRRATSPSVTIDPTYLPVPVATSLSPANAIVGSAALTLNVFGSGFVASSVIRWNGGDRSTTFVNSGRLQTLLSSADLASVGTATVTVFTGAPGGGTSAALPFAVKPPPSLTVSTTSVAGGGSVTVTLADGPGNSTDWLALAAVGATNTSYLQWTYVGSGVNTRTWTVTMPATGGPFEFRLFVNEMKAATSPAVSLLPGAPVLTSLSPTSAAVGSGALLLTVNGSGFTNLSTVRWNGGDRATTFVSATKLTANIPASDLAAASTAAVTVYTPPPAGGTSSTSLSFIVGEVPAPTLTVNTTSAAPGASVTMTLTNGTGNAYDWLAFAPTSASNGSYLQWVYVGAGLTTRTWTVTMPASGGPFEFRLFVNAQRVATSPAITLVGGAPVLTSLSPSTAAAGSAAFTLTVNGTGFTSGSIVRWNGADRVTTFVNATRLTAAIPASDLATAGTASVTAFVPGAGTSGSLPFVIGAASAPTLTVSATKVAPGASVTVTLTNGLGGSSDWIAFAPTGGANTSYLQYTYVGGGVTTRTWTVTAPTSGGPYEFRLFVGGGYSLAATSASVTVDPALNPGQPSLAVSTTSVAVGSPVTVTLTNGFGGSTDWLAFARTDAANSSYIQWVYVGTGVTTRTWTITAPSTGGTYEFRLFLNNGYTRGATSPVVTVHP